MIQSKNEEVIKTITTKFLDKITMINQNKVILSDEINIDLDQKFSIRKWVKKNSSLENSYSRRKYVELSKQIDMRIRHEIKKIKQNLIRQRFKEIKKHHAKFMKQIRRQD